MTNTLKSIIKTPIGSEDLEAYKKLAEDNMIKVFQLNDQLKKIPLDDFLENKDHGAEHTYNVFKKSLEIAQQLTKEANSSIDTTLLYIMSGMHDSGRFRTPIPNSQDTDKQKEAKTKKKSKAEREHARYGVAQIKLAIQKLKQQNISISPENQQKLEDYILNHDFFNTRLDGTKYQEPSSIEGQITRLADRISIPIEEEIKRYRETGKRLNTAYFKSDISFQERIDFNFANMGTYIKSGKFDEFTFFLSLLSQTPQDFSNPILANIYQQRSSTKNKGIQTILQIAEQEGYPPQDIQEMQTLINKYLKHFNINF